MTLYLQIHSLIYNSLHTNKNTINPNQTKNNFVKLLATVYNV